MILDSELEFADSVALTKTVGTFTQLGEVDLGDTFSDTYDPAVGGNLKLRIEFEAAATAADGAASTLTFHMHTGESAITESEDNMICQTPDRVVTYSTDPVAAGTVVVLDVPTHALSRYLSLSYSVANEVLTGDPVVSAYLVRDADNSFYHAAPTVFR